MPASWTCPAWSHPPSRQPAFGIAEAAAPTPEAVTEEQQQCAGGSGERAHLSCFLGCSGKVFDLASMGNYTAEGTATLRLTAGQRRGRGGELRKGDELER